MTILRDMFFAARGVRPGEAPEVSRRVLVDRACELEGAPEHLTERHLESIETGSGNPDGIRLRFFAAAADLDFVETLRNAGTGYWPPIKAISPEVFRKMCEDIGAEIQNSQGPRFLVVLKEKRQ